MTDWHKGKTVLVAGADGALGSAAVNFFGALGATVVATTFSESAANSVRESMASTGWRGEVHAVDLGNYSACQELAKKVQEKHKTVDWVFNAAGGFRYTSTTDCSEKDFNFLLQGNFISCWHLAKFFVPLMQNAKYGRVVFVSARKTQESGQANFGIYTATKAALDAMAKGLADEVKDSGITVNLIAPSIIDTAANRQAMPDADYSKWVTTSDILKSVDFLFSDQGKAVNGSTVTISGRL